VTRQFGQSPDPIDALAACAAAPGACTNYSTVLVGLIPVPADRRVLGLISGAMMLGPQGGTNPFYGSSMAVDIMGVHSAADPDGAADLLMQATQALLQDDVGSQASQGPDGFFTHVIDRLLARALYSPVPVPPDLQLRVYQTLQALAASTTLADTAQRARDALNLFGPLQATPTPTSTSTPVVPSTAAPTSPAPPSTVAPTTPPVTSSKLTAGQIGAIAVGIGAVVIGGTAFLLSRLRREPRTLGMGRLRRRVEAGLRRQNDRVSDL
jgi:hypothetical protein